MTCPPFILRALSLGQKTRFLGIGAALDPPVYVISGTFMKIVIVTQLLAALIVIVLTGLFAGRPEAVSVLYGAALGMVNAMLTKRSANRALLAAEESPRYGFVAMYSGLMLRYAIVILGLLIGFRVLQLVAIPLISSFVLMIIVQVIASFAMGPDIGTNGTD